MRVSTADFIRNYSTLADRALAEPVTITKHGRDRLVMVSAAEYERLKRRDRQVFQSAELPDEVLEAIARAEVPPEFALMKNIQVIDDAINASYSIFAATEAEFSAIFPRKGQDIEFSEDFFRRAKPEAATEIMSRIWERRIDKKAVVGIHGTLFYGLPEKKKFYERKREPVIDWRHVP